MEWSPWKVICTFLAICYIIGNIFIAWMPMDDDMPIIYIVCDVQGTVIISSMNQYSIYIVCDV